MTEARDARTRSRRPARAGRPAALLGLPRPDACRPVHAGGRSGRRRPHAGLVAARGARRALGAPILPDGMTLESATDDDLLRLRMRPSARATFDELKAAPTALVDEDRSLGWVERNILPDGRWNLAPEPLARPARRRGGSGAARADPASALAAGQLIRA